MVPQRKCLQKLKDYVPGKSKKEVAEKWGLDKIVKLASNENPLGVPREAQEAIRTAADSIHLYPIGHSPVLQEKIATRVGLDPDNVLVANGSDEVIWLLCTAFLNPGEVVLSSVETFSEYEFCSYLLDGQYRKVPLKNGVFDLDALAVEVQKEEVRMVFLCSPNNPTGTLIPKADLQSFLGKVPEDTLVVVDQAYVDFVAPEEDYQLTEWIESFENLVLLRTFSKMYGLAGLRLGYALTDSNNVQALLKVKQPFNVNLVAQKAGEASLEATQFVEDTLRNNALGKQRLEALFQEFQLEFFATHANFIAVRIGSKAGEFCQFCESRGLILRWLKSFQLEEYIRVTIGLPEELDLFESLLREWEAK